jgi:transcriptional regulator GlxA family with amidase domain
MRVAVFVVDGVADFGLSAVLETLRTAGMLRTELPSPPEPVTVRTVGLGAQVRTGNGYLAPTLPAAELGGDDDVIVVPALAVLDAERLVGLVADAAARPAREAIGAAAARGAHLAAACTGTFLLAEAGVLDGEPATTSWWLGPAFRRRYPRVALDERRILCRGAGVTTAGAALAHVDLALSLVARVSPALAELTGRYLLAGPRTGQDDFAIPAVIARGDPLVAAFERWIRAHVGEPFRIADAARELGVTERSLQRAMHAELGMSPRDFVDRIRLERAAQLLRSTSLTVDAIANRVGYLNGGTLRGLLRRRGLTVARLRG